MMMHVVWIRYHVHPSVYVDVLVVVIRSPTRFLADCLAMYQSLFLALPLSLNDDDVLQRYKMKTLFLMRWLRESDKRVHRGRGDHPFWLSWFPSSFLEVPQVSLESLPLAFSSIIIDVINHIVSTNRPITVIHPIFFLFGFHLDKVFALALALGVKLRLLLRSFLVGGVGGVV